MKHKKFDTNEDYYRWFENQQQNKILNDYFGKEKNAKLERDQ